MNDQLMHLLRNIGGGVEPPVDQESMGVEYGRFAETAAPAMAMYAQHHPAVTLGRMGYNASQNPKVQALAQALADYAGQAGDAVGGAMDGYSNMVLGKRR